MMCQAAISLWLPLFGELVFSAITAILMFERYVALMASVDGKRLGSGVLAADGKAELNTYKYEQWIDLANRPYRRYDDAALSALGDKLLQRIPRLKIGLAVLLVAIVAIDLGLCRT